jgi:hypothetical protein
LAERVFAKKLENVGFGDILFDVNRPFGIDDCATLPLFTPELIQLMRQLIPPERATRVARSVIVRARRP